MPNTDRSIDDTTESVASQIRNGQQQVMEQVISMIDSLRADMQAQQGAVAMPQQPRIVQQAPFRPFPFGKQYTFGLVLVPTGVIVCNPMAIRAFDTSSPYHGPAETTVTLTVGTARLVCWQWTGGALTVMPTAQSTVPVNTATTLYGLIASFDVTSPDGGTTLVISLSAGGEVQCGSPAVIDPWQPADVSDLVNGVALIGADGPMFSPGGSTNSVFGIDESGTAIWLDTLIIE